MAGVVDGGEKAESAELVGKGSDDICGTLQWLVANGNFRCGTFICPSGVGTLLGACKKHEKSIQDSKAQDNADTGYKLCHQQHP